MKKLLFVTALCAFSFTAAAQSTSSYPVYERVYEQGGEYCHEVVGSQQLYNPTGAIVGAVVGYQLGRGYDHRRSGYHYNGRGYTPGRGQFYSDRLNGYRDHPSRAGRYSGAVAGAVVGGYAGRGYTRQTVCEPSQGYYREVFVGYRTVTRYPDGRMVESFQPSR